MKYLDEIAKAQTDMAKTVIIDIDGVLVDFDNCTEGCDYSGYPHTINLRRDKCPEMDGAKEALSVFKNMGLTIILVTSRVEEERDVTVKWLEDHDLLYDSLVMGKPRGIIYIDDLAYKFTDWNETLHEVIYRYNKMR